MTVSNKSHSAHAENKQSRRILRRRLRALLRPHRRQLVAMFALGTGAIALNLAGPKLLGRATDLIFAGLASKQLPAGSTKAQAIAKLRAEGRDTLANVFTTVDLVPGQGIDFG